MNTMQNATALKATSLNKAFGALTVASNVSFSVPKHGALGIIGPNGAGKTTLFNLITGTVRADSGVIKLFGQDVSELDPRRRCLAGIARSFQVPQPFGSLSAYENVLIAAAYGRGLTETAARPHAREALEMTGLSARGETDAGSLTLLNRKRLELARALATGPRLLLLDEIAGGMTEGECSELVDLIRQIRATGVAIIWIEHVLHALLRVVDRILVLDFGKVIAEGEPEMILKDPRVTSVYLGPDGHESLVS